MSKEIVVPDTDNDEYSCLVVGVRHGDILIIGDSVLVVTDNSKNWTKIKIRAKRDVPIKRLRPKN